MRYPAAYDSVIAVTGTDPADLPGYFAPLGDALELSAPGVDIVSTVAGGGYDVLSGSSQAAPHVAGAAALFMPLNTKDLNGDGLVNNRDLRLLLQSTATDLGDPGKDRIFGYGLVNARSAALGDEGPEDGEACWLSEIASYLIDHLLSAVVWPGASPEIKRWLESARSTLTQFLESVWTWKTSGPKAIAGTFWKGG